MEVFLERKCFKFVIVGWSKVKLYNFIMWSRSKQLRNLAFISKSCLWWLDSCSPGFWNWGNYVPSARLMCLLDFFWLRACLLKKKWGGNRRNRFYSKLWKTRFEDDSGERRGGGYGGENPGTLSIYDVPMETAEHIWVSVLCMLDCILSHNCRNTLLLHKLSNFPALGVQKIKPCCGWRG